MTEDTHTPDDETKGKGEATPDGWQDDADLVAMVKAARKESDKHLADWLKEAKDNYDLTAGHQWSEEDRATLEEGNRPAVVFNRIAPVLDSVAGTEISSRQQVQYIPRTVGKAGVNELLTGAAQWVRDRCDAEDEESDAFFDLLVCGIGVTETRLDYTDDAEGQVLIERVDPLTSRWDPTAKKRNLADKGWCQRDKWMTAEEIEDKWPDAELNPSTPAANDDSDERTQPHDATSAWLYKNDATGYDPKQNKYLVIHHQWFTCEDFHRVLDPQSGQIVELDEQKMVVAKAVYGDALQSVKLKRKVYRQVFVTGGDVLEKSKLPTQKGGFTLKFMTGKRDRNTNTWYGLVRPMTDPQRWANKFFSQILHIINSNAKGGLLIEVGAVDNVRKLEEDWSKSDSVIEVNEGALSGDKIQPKPPAPFPVGPEKLMEFSVASIRDATGVNLEMLGMADRDQPGVIEAHRKQAGLVILSTFFDALRRYRKMNGRLLADFIQNYLSDGRLVKITGHDGTEQYIPLLRQNDTMDYDVIVDESPSSHNVKERVFGMLMQMLPNLLKMGFPVPDELVDYLPVPASFAAKWKQEIQRQKQQPHPDPHMAIEQAKLQANMQAQQAKGQADMQIAQAKMQQEAQLEQLRAQMQAQVDQNRQNAEAQQQHMKMAQQAQLDQLKTQLDQQKHANEMAFEWRKAQLESATKVEVAEVMSKNKVNDAATQAAASQVSQDL